MISVTCPHCNGKAIVTHSVVENTKLKVLYADCQNVDCYARFVVKMRYSHDISAPVGTQLAAVHEMIANMNPHDRNDLFNQYKQPSLL